MGRHSFLGEFEHVLLLAIVQLGPNAHAPALATFLEREIERRVSRGALYSALESLERKGYLAWEVEGTTADRGGHPRRHFSLTREGVAALRATQRALDTLTAGLDELLERGHAE